jgi:hypothetical protein
VAGEATLSAKNADITGHIAEKVKAAA